MNLVQNVVQAFVEAQQEALDRISRLESEKQQALSRLGVVEKEIASHKTHIIRLKDELQAACRRQMSDDGLSDDGKFAALVNHFLIITSTECSTLHLALVMWLYKLVVIVTLHLTIRIRARNFYRLAIEISNEYSNCFSRNL